MKMQHLCLASQFQVKDELKISYWWQHYLIGGRQHKIFWTEFHWENLLVSAGREHLWTDSFAASGWEDLTAATVSDFRSVALVVAPPQYAYIDIETRRCNVSWKLYEVWTETLTLLLIVRETSRRSGSRAAGFTSAWAAAETEREWNNQHTASCPAQRFQGEIQENTRKCRFSIVNKI